MKASFAIIFATSAVAGMLGIAWLENYLQAKLRERRVARRRKIREQIMAHRAAEQAEQ